MLDDAGARDPATDARRLRDRDEWARCKSGTLGRRKSAVEDLLDALSFKVADEPRACGDRVYLAAAQAGPLMELARMGVTRSFDAGEVDAGWRFALAIADVEDVVYVEPWASSGRWRLVWRGSWRVIWSVDRGRVPSWIVPGPRMVGQTAHHQGITVSAEDLQTLIAAARYCASRTWPGLVAPIEPDLASRGVCPAPPLASCALGCVRVCVCGASGGVTWTSGWTC